MENIHIVSSIVIWIGFMAAMLIFRNKLLVFDWEKGLKIYLEDKERPDEERQETNQTSKRIFEQKKI